MNVVPGDIQLESKEGSSSSLAKELTYRLLDCWSCFAKGAAPSTQRMRRLFGLTVNKIVSILSQTSRKTFC